MWNKKLTIGLSLVSNDICSTKQKKVLTTLQKSKRIRVDYAKKLY